jgi:hypothetical protein
LYEGEVLPLDHAQGTELFFKAGKLVVSLPAEVAKVVGQSAPSVVIGDSRERVSPMGDRVQRTQAAQKEAVRRYPMLGLKNSAENQMFVAEYQTLRQVNPKFFDDSEWPLKLAEFLAKREGWSAGSVSE